MNMSKGGVGYFGISVIGNGGGGAINPGGTIKPVSHATSYGTCTKMSLMTYSSNVKAY